MTFYFYDLETSGISAKAQRIMQFAGQRTDEQFNPIGEPHNWLIRLTDEILPDPEAILVTGITPQKTLEEGYSEAEFLKLFAQDVVQPDTTIVGFNNIRFDDEFIRYTLWRNFYDPYSWQWAEGCGRWDLLDVVRMVRALRPDGIEWPVDAKGEPTNRLELLTKANGLDHDNAHDALNDVQATIALARLLHEKQPKITGYLLNHSTKQSLAKMIDPNDPKPFLYTSGRYSNKWHKTTAVTAFAPALNNNVLAYDLRQDPVELAKMSDEELATTAFTRHEITEVLPVKVIKLNACPSVAPLGVLDDASQKRLQLPLKTVEQNYAKLRSIKNFAQRLQQLYEAQEGARKAKFASQSGGDPDLELYDGFVGNEDKTAMQAVRAADSPAIKQLKLTFKDPRLQQMLPRYKARNFEALTNADERAAWEAYRAKRLLKGVPGQLPAAEFAARLSELASSKTDGNSQFLLQELQLYAESIMPAAVD